MENQSSQTSNGARKVAIYSTPTCTYCNMAKNFFKEHNIEYTNYDVATDAEKRQEMIEISGQMGVPVIAIDDQLMVGFDREAVAGALGVEA